MKQWLTIHLQTLSLVIRRLLRTPLASMLTAMVIGITLSLPAGLYVLLQSAGTVASNIQGEPQISVFLALTATRGDAQQIKTQLKQHAGVKSFRFVSRDEALAELKQNPGLELAVSSLERNPLPDAFIISSKFTNPEQLEHLREEIGRLPGVEHAQLDSAWAKRLHALLQLGQQAVMILSTLLGIAMVAIIGNTIRLQILTQREEIEVSKLIGATNGFIRRPFLYNGALQGLAGGGTAWAIITLSTALLNQHVAEISSLYGSDFRLHTLSGADSLSILLLATAFGWVGAYAAVWRYLKDIEPR